MFHDDANLLTGAPLGWIASLCASFTWAFSVLLYRRYGAGQSAVWLNFFKGLLALLFFGVSILVFSIDIDISMKAILLLALSGFIGILIGDTSFFYALPRIGATMTSAIQSLAPGLTAVLAGFLIDESLTWRQWLGLVLTSASMVFLILRQNPRRHVSTESNFVSPRDYAIGVSFALVAAVCQAVGAVIAKPVIVGMSSVVSASLRLWFPVVVLLVWQVCKHRSFRQEFRDFMASGTVVPLAIAGMVGTFLGLILMMHGMRLAPLGIVLSLTSTYPIWIMIVEKCLGISRLGQVDFLLVISGILGIWLMF